LAKLGGAAIFGILFLDSFRFTGKIERIYLKLKLSLDTPQFCLVNLVDLETSNTEKDGI
jgi:hypothetical protein